MVDTGRTELRSDKIKFQRIQYRTPDLLVDRWAILPDLYVSSFLRWLTDSDSAEVVSITTHDRITAPATRVLSELAAPRHWPDYRRCARYVSDTVIMGER